jgi:hypothetical protein
LALRFCAYALQAETVRDVAKIPDAGARTLALKGMADTNDAFQKAVTDTLDRARVRYQKKNEPDASVPTSKPSTAPPGTPAPSEKK